MFLLPNNCAKLLNTHTQQHPSTLSQLQIGQGLKIDNLIIQRSAKIKVFWMRQFKKNYKIDFGIIKSQNLI
jgi:hypothetical protein